MSFAEKSISYKKQLEAIETEKAQAEQELELVKSSLCKAHKNKVHIAKKLDSAAFDAILQFNDPEAWQYIKQKTRYTDESWSIIEERLPKLLEIKHTPDELCLHISSKAGSGSEFSEAILLSSSDIPLDIDQARIRLRNDYIFDIPLAEDSPLKQLSSRTPSLYISGLLLGRKEIEVFIYELQKDPMYSGLMFNVALELCSNTQALKYWYNLTDNIRYNTIHECLKVVMKCDPWKLLAGGFCPGRPNLRHYRNELYLNKVINVIYAESKVLFDANNPQQQVQEAKKLLDKFSDLGVSLEDASDLLNKIARAETFIWLNRELRREEPYVH